MPSPMGYLRKLRLTVTDMKGTVVLEWDSDQDAPSVRRVLAGAGTPRPQEAVTGWLEAVVKEITAPL